MPELPEVETVARSLRPRLVGRAILGVETSGLALRRPINLPQLKSAMANARVEAVRRLGKYLVIELSTAHALVVHLGMTGRLVFGAPASPRPPHTHAALLVEGAVELRYVDPRRFGVLQVYPLGELDASPELSVLGVDPLDDAFTLERLGAELARARTPIKTFLLDQTRIAGLGNIYACEALHHARLGPRRRADGIGPARTRRLHAAIRAVLEAGVANRGTSFSDYVDADGAPGENQNTLAVYGRVGLPCPRCGAAVRRLVQQARSTFYCPRCQT